MSFFIHPISNLYWFFLCKIRFFIKGYSHDIFYPDEDDYSKRYLVVGPSKLSNQEKYDKYFALYYEGIQGLNYRFIYYSVFIIKYK